MLVALAWRNLWRQPVRTGLSLASIAFAAAVLVFMLSFQLGVYDTMKGNVLRIFDGLAQIQPPGYAEDPEVRKVIAAPQRLIAQAVALPQVTAAAPRGMSYVIFANGELSFGAEVVGVDPLQEPRVATLAATIRRGRYLQAPDSDAVVLGATLARNLKVDVGDRVTLLGSAADGSIAADSLRVVGVFSTGMRDIDRQIAQMPLTRFQATFALPDSANVIVLAGAGLQAMEQAAPALRGLARAEGLSFVDWGRLEPALKQAITLDFSSGLLWYASLVLVVVIIILNTLWMSVMERTREFGMLLAVGMRSALIGRMLWMELVLLALIGNGIGIVLGGAVTLWLQHRGIGVHALQSLFAQWGLPGRIYPSLSLTSAVAAPLVIVVCVAVAGLFPYRRVRRLEPIAALGHA
jgi:putative ABC transport system permease protein